MSFDPLSNTPPTIPEPLASTLNLSPLARRQPLPGQQQTQYRAQPLPPAPERSHWTREDERPLRSDSREDRLRESSSRGGAGTMQPRSPQISPSFERERQNQREAVGEAYHSSAAPSAQGGNSYSGRNEQGRGNPGVGGVGLPADGYVRIRITGLEKNRRDVWIKFNAESNLPTFRNTLYRSISRSYTEFNKFAEALAAVCPSSIIPALPLCQTSAGSDEEEERIVKANFQKWVARITKDKMVLREDELRGFIEGEYGYTPNTRSKRRTPPTFHMPRGIKPAAVDHLSASKSALSHLEQSYTAAYQTVSTVAKARRAVAVGMTEAGSEWNRFGQSEQYRPLGVGIEGVARVCRSMAELMAAHAAAEHVTLGDAFEYQARNARSAKDTLVSRDVILDEHRDAAKAAISRRKAIEKLKSSSNIKSERVDEALGELETAMKQEVLLSKRLIAISEHLEPSLATHSQNTQTDLLAALLSHARSSLQCEKLILKEWEILRPELRNIRKLETGVYYIANRLEGSKQVTSASRNVVSESQSQTESDRRGPLSNARPTSSRGSISGTSQYSRDDQSIHNSPNANENVHNGGRFEGNGTKSMFVGRGTPNFGPKDLSASVPGGGTMGRRSIQSMAKGVVVADDKRQRVDAKMAASMLSGF